MHSSRRPLPMGVCWCGCRAETTDRSFFLPGHDKRAESAVISVEYGSVARFLMHHGYGPSEKNAVEEMARSTGEPRDDA